MLKNTYAGRTFFEMWKQSIIFSCSGWQGLQAAYGIDHSRVAFFTYQQTWVQLVRRLPLALKWMFKKNEEEEMVRSPVLPFAVQRPRCYDQYDNIDRCNSNSLLPVVGALFWMIVAFFGMATKFSEVFWQLNTVWLQKTDTALADDIYRKGMGPKWKVALARSLHSSVFV